MTGIGSYFYLVWGIWLRHCLNERQDEYMLSWPSYFSIPEVLPISKVNGTATSGYTNGHTNGYTNGHINGHAKYTNGHIDSDDRKSV
jgi:dihydroceramidase